MNQPGNIDRRTKFIGWAIIAVFLILFAEIGSFIVYKTVIMKRAGFLVYDSVPNLNSTTQAEYLNIRHPVLGWPPKRASDYYDASGARPVPAFPVPGGERVSLYGDSFVYGSEVDNDAAWGNQLSIELGARVANFGVAGYGTDQAYLRFRDNSRDQAKVVFLGIYPHNILRNVNQYRFLLASDEPFSFKPRFVLEGGQMHLVPIPTIPCDQVARFVEAPQDFLAHEAFLPDSTYGPLRFTFPNTVSLVKLFFKERTINWLLDKPSWLAYVQPGHPSESLEVTAAIVSRFHEDCLERDATLVTLFFPTPSAYDWYIESGTLAMEPLGDALRDLGVRVIDLAPVFAERLGDESYCDLLTHPEKCKGHLNPRGSRMLAEIIRDYLQSENLLRNEEESASGKVGGLSGKDLL